MSIDRVRIGEGRTVVVLQNLRGTGTAGAEVGQLQVLLETTTGVARGKAPIIGRSLRSDHLCRSRDVLVVAQRDVIEGRRPYHHNPGRRLHPDSYHVVDTFE